jgi:hypothetical protein
VEEGGGVRGSEAARRSARGDQAAVCLHIHTQSGGFGSDEAHRPWNFFVYYFFV